MFAVREVYFERLPFIANGLLWSGTACAFAVWRMRARDVSFRTIGIRRPSGAGWFVVATAVTLGLTVGSIVVFEVVKDQWALAPDVSSQTTQARFGDLAGNWSLLLAILPFVWLESALEELLDRGFLITWIERVGSNTRVATAVAVLLQAALFGFRHSRDLSERSVSVALIGLVLGVAYVALRRNLWPLIGAHGLLNSMSMIERVI
jgi:hypothetical protein